MKRLVLILPVIIIIMITGCSKTEESAIRETVKNYNKSLVIALKTDAETLKETATQRERGRVQIFITQMADENKTVDTQLKKLGFQSVRILADREWAEVISQYREENHNRRIPGEESIKTYKSGALAVTEELWSYQYLDYKTREKIGKSKLLGYSVAYFLVKEDKKWKIADVKFEEKEIK